MAYSQLLKKLLVMALLQEIRTEFLLPSGKCNVPNGICETRCRCKEGFIALNESCLGKIGTTCTMQSDCIPEAACDDTFGGGTCTCNDGLVAYSNNTECRLKVGRPCNVTAAPHCIQNAECDVNGAKQNTCTCRQGFSVNNDKTKCLGNAGTACAATSECISKAVCSENKCTCEDLHVPSENGTKCIGYVGITCASTNECIQHAVCTGHTCTCEDMYASSEDKSTCIGYVGAICDQHSGTCVAHSECIDGQCACKNGYQADGNGSKTCKEKEDGLKDIIWIYIGSVTGFLLVLAVVTCTVTHYCCRKKLQNLC
ncbi:prion-like-(Q/N-rich) domain-bearing protein 25 isoform X5 [Dreissena polymorpha]|uniref:prion-like-(Q/N-rich) domain-bearing protein 25 isoform X5 n=1 Tax=Dreissena polymorpha TaxID=45954 RepID=UPI002263CF86|nr:prion-like-(Q/N-rich) domain-bearing protein 25 isoform X5 [Dreissena polymorpha]